MYEQNTFRLKRIVKESETETTKNYPESKKNERIIALCKELGATEDYCGGTATAAYVDHSLFDESGIKITVQDWKCKQDDQLYTNQSFIHNLSVIDLLMNVSHKRAYEVITNKNESNTQKYVSLFYGFPTMQYEMFGLLSEAMTFSKGIMI